MPDNNNIPNGFIHPMDGRVFEGNLSFDTEGLFSKGRDEAITDKNGRKQTKFKQNSAAKYMLYSLSIIDMFTDIEIDFKKSVEQIRRVLLRKLKTK